MIIENPNAVANNLEIGVLSALWYFEEVVIDNIGNFENASVEDVTEEINTAERGLENRREWFNRIQRIFNNGN